MNNNSDDVDIQMAFSRGMNINPDDYKTTFFRGRIRFRRGDNQMSHYELEDGSAWIAVPNHIHVRLIEQIRMPSVYEIVAPMTHVIIEKGVVPENYQVLEGHSYYREIEGRFVPLQMADMQKRTQSDGAIKRTGCLSMIILVFGAPIILWIAM